MATAEISLSTTEWTRITAAGESGTCWKKAGGHIVVDHTDQETADTLPTSNINVAIGKSKRVPLDSDDGDVLAISADNTSDIYYAIAVAGNSSGETFKIAVDVI